MSEEVKSAKARIGVYFHEGGSGCCDVRICVTGGIGEWDIFFELAADNIEQVEELLEALGSAQMRVDAPVEWFDEE